MSNKKVCIIIPNYNDKKYSDDCFFSLQKINYPKDLYEIVLFDNASTDDSVDCIQKNWPQVKIIKNDRNYGFAQGYNLALEKVLSQNNFDYVYLLNHDTQVDPDFLTQAVMQAENEPNIGSVQSRIMLWDQKQLVNSLGNEIHFLGFGFCRGYKFKFDQKKFEKKIAYSSGAAVLIKVEALNKVGYFPEDFFMYHEDLDLGWRMLLAGFKNLLVPTSIVYHKFSFSKSIQKYYFMERNRLIVLFKNYKIKTLILVCPALLAMEVGGFVFAIKSGWWKEKLKAYAYFFHSSNWQKIIEGRKKINQIRKVKDKEILKNFVGKILYQEPEMQNFVLEKIANPLFNAYFFLVKKIIFW